MHNRQRFNAFARIALIKPPDIPDYHLMIGTAERLDGLPVLLYKTSNLPKSVAVNMINITKNMTSEDIEQAIADNTLEVNDLNWNMATLGV